MTTHFDPTKFRSGTVKPAARVRRAQTAFVQLDLKTLAAVCKASRCQGAFIWAFIRYEAWRHNNATVKVSNEALKVYGIHRNAKRRTIDILEQIGLIAVERKGKQAIAVTLIAWP
jgi:hypothetical protein